MHIPDGYLSPQTCVVLYGAAVPFWVTAGRRVKKVVRNRYVPLVAIAASYSFLVMMFNIPIPNGTSAHAAGAVLIAVLLGPWAAVIAVSIALLIQALFFGDGGVLAYGGNVVNMAVLMPFAGYGVYKVLARHTALTAPGRAAAAGVGAYVGINVAALAAAVEFGIQPDLFYKLSDSGAKIPLYAPFHLSQSIPAMLFAHLLVAGAVDGALTIGVILYLQRANVALLRINNGAASETHDDLAPHRKVGYRWAFTGLGVMTVLVPLGLLGDGSAFGEDGPDQLDLKRYGLGAVPSGLAKYSDFWSHALFPGYDFKAGSQPTLGYYASAAIGTLLIGAVVIGSFAVARLVRGRRGRDDAFQPSTTS